MRKFNFLLTALLALFTTTAHADRILYSENYETGGIPTTWTVNGNASKTYATIAGDTEGKYLSFTNTDNGRSAHCFWGESIFDEVKQGLSEYSVSVDFQIQAFGNNQVNGEFAIFSGEGCASTNGQGNDFAGDNKSTWANYSLLTNNCLFAIAQDSKVATKDDPTHWFVNGDSTDVVAPTAGTWYNLTLTVNVATREVSYVLKDLDGTFKKTGSKTMAEDASVFASGLFLLGARYWSVTNVDNINVSIPGDFANKPVIALTGINMAERTYTISFMQGETLHVTGTDGTENTISYFDGDPQGTYVYTTTTSGTLTAYTTAGTMTSEPVTMEVVCEPITLPEPSLTIVSASEGFSKTYQFNVDKSKIDLQPDVFFDFSFAADNGTDSFETPNQNNGAKVTLPSKGVLTIVTKATGYASSTTTLKNDIEFGVLYDIDFEHMTGAEIQERGFTTSESNVNDQWNTRGRLYYSYIKGTEVGDTLKVYPYGETLENNTFEEYEMLGSTVDEEKAHSIFSPVYVWFDTVNLHMKTGVGLISPGRKGDDNSGAWVQNATLGVDGLTDEDFIVVGKITSYGTSYNPEYKVTEGYNEETAAAAYAKEHKYLTSEVYPGTSTFLLYRVDTSLARVLILREKSKITGIVELPYNKIVSDHNAPIYNLNGVQVDAKNLKKGVYVKQGKKFVVR
jgi:hypothetical protein